MVSPSRAYYLVIFLFTIAFQLYATPSGIYRVIDAGLNPLQLILVGSVLELTVFLFEIPTGVVADVYSRKLSLIIGYVLIGIGIIVESLAPVFGVIILAQVIWGFGATFESGAWEAWITDETADKSQLTSLFLRGTQVAAVGTIVGIVLATVSGRSQHFLPMRLGGIGFILLGIIVYIILPENGFKPEEKNGRSTFQTMRDTFTTGWTAITQKSSLKLLAVISFVYGLSAEGLDRLWDKHLLDNFTFPTLLNQTDELVWFGTFGIIMSLLMLVISELIKRRLESTSKRTLISYMIGLNALMAVSALAFALAGNFALAISFYLSTFTLRNANRPLFGSWLNQEIDSHNRATVLSMFAQLDALGQFTGGPPVGMIGTRWGTRAALVAVAVLLSPIVWLINKARKK